MKNIIICDIDGTLSDLSHRLHFIKGEGKKDWRAFHEAVYDDAVHKDVREILRALLTPGRRVIYVSGRMDPSMDLTYYWLTDNGFPTGDLYMRAADDLRRDDIVKEEILDTKLKLTPADVLCVLDDRDRVVQMWRRRGFRVLQVANGDF